MKLETRALIHQLAANATPVRRFASPWRRCAAWFAISLAYVAAIIFIQPRYLNLWQMADARFVIEQVAVLATAVSAAVAAFWSVVPGHDRRVLLLPLPPLAIWLATLGNGCVNDWLRLGRAALELRVDSDCLPAAVAVGIVPTIAIFAMLRRGAPLIPHATLALAVAAVAAVTNLALRLFHPGEASIMVLVWHFGGTLVLAMLAGLLGRHVLTWRRVRSA